MKSQGSRGAWAGASAALRDRWVGGATHFKWLACVAFVLLIVGLVTQKWLFAGIMAAATVGCIALHFATNAASAAAGRRARRDS